ncbi:phage tail protein [Pantoea rodasii]|uniref:Phage tail protein n=1 Tax=Pantoea rodasii TaxID=1076549 RepID=A0A2M9WHI0_9GAMM|nr:putative phage tail protein [Pantoea rodasii]ORM62214.1 hypothetical protein HA45_18040 [Pantoea rodasii]PJZ07020.1 phage tail protein [Pantoea rodasii]
MNRADYQQLLSLLLPAVTYEPSGEQISGELSAEAKLLAVLDAVIAGLLTAIDPESATHLLTDWERVYDLMPDESDTLQQRRASVMAALAETGGLSRQYFTALAKALGYDITIGEPEDPMWRWTVNVTGTPERVWYFRVGESAVGDRLEESGDPGLDKIFQRLKPAHTECLFKYSEDSLT